MNGTEEIGATIRALTEISAKKKKALTQIFTICENQQTLLAAAPSEEQAEFMAGLSREKQKLIDEVIEFDDVFASIYKTIATRMEQAAATHFPLIQALQDEIKEVTRLDAKIRAAEEATRVYAASIPVAGQPSAGETKRRPTLPPDKIAEKYRAHSPRNK